VFVGCSVAILVIYSMLYSVSIVLWSVFIFHGHLESISSIQDLFLSVGFDLVMYLAIFSSVVCIDCSGI